MNTILRAFLLFIIFLIPALIVLGFGLARKAGFEDFPAWVVLTGYCVYLGCYLGIFGLFFFSEKKKDWHLFGKLLTLTFGYVIYSMILFFILAA